MVSLYTTSRCIKAFSFKSFCNKNCLQSIFLKVLRAKESQFVKDTLVWPKTGIKSFSKSWNGWQWVYQCPLQILYWETGSSSYASCLKIKGGCTTVTKASILCMFLEGNFWTSNPEICDYINPRKYSSRKKRWRIEKVEWSLLSEFGHFFSS